MWEKVGRGLIVPIALLGMLAACEEEAPEIIEYVRAIKTFTITDIASGQVRKYSGSVKATDSSGLSFEVGGKVQKVNVKLGDAVKKGQVLATLDKRPYDLDVQAANADLSKARSSQKQAHADFKRQKTLFSKGWVAKARLDQAEQAAESARAQVNYAISKLNLAKRDQANTVLAAPFDGVISGKEVDPFVEVKAGQKLFDIDASGALEVSFDVPESIISRLAPGVPVSIRFTSGDVCHCKGRITEISKVSGAGNVFPVKASLLTPPEAARSGMTVEVSVLLENQNRTAGYMLPLTAIAPSDGDRKGYVFVFDRASSTVRKTAVKVQGAQENLLAVEGEGVGPGAIVASAGVHFLVDGQKVKLLNP